MINRKHPLPYSSPLFKSVIDKYSQTEELKHYSDIVSYGLDKAEEILMRKYFLRKGSVLDIGCGGGREAMPLFKEGHKVTGVDIVPEMLRNTRKNFIERGFDIPLAAMDICNLGFIPESFDYVPLVNHLISFVPKKENRVKAFKEINRVLKPGGILLVSIISRNRGMVHRLYWSFVNSYRFFLRSMGGPCLESGDRFVVKISGASSRGRMFVHYHTLRKAVRELGLAGFEIIESRSEKELIEGVDQPSSREKDYTIYIVAKKHSLKSEYTDRRKSEGI